MLMQTTYPPTPSPTDMVSRVVHQAAETGGDLTMTFVLVVVLVIIGLSLLALALFKGSKRI